MSKKTVVLGASLKPDRYSNFVIQKLTNHKHEVKAIGLREGEVAGVTIQTGLQDFEDVDTVTLYLNPKRQQAYYDYIIDLKPNRVIFNPGTENSEFYALLKAADIEVEVACTLVLLSTDQY